MGPGWQPMRGHSWGAADAYQIRAGNLDWDESKGLLKGGRDIDAFIGLGVRCLRRNKGVAWNAKCGIQPGLGFLNKNGVRWIVRHH